MINKLVEACNKKNNNLRIKNYVSLFFNILILLSFFLFSISLHKLGLPKILVRDWLDILISFGFMVGAYLLLSYGWKKVLESHNIIIEYKKAFISETLSVLGKYIPGRLWPILGQAFYIGKLGYSYSKLTMLSLRYQVFSIWSALAISSLSLCYFNTKFLFLWGAVIFILSILLFYKKLHFFILRLVKKVLKRDNLEIPLLTVSESKLIFIIFFSAWISWTIAFWFLCLSFDYNITFFAAFIFPAAVNIGILAVVVPAGLGIREGVIISFLVLIGLSTKEAISAAIMARYWYMAGELVMFLCGYILDRFSTPVKIKD